MFVCLEEREGRVHGSASCGCGAARSQARLLAGRVMEAKSLRASHSAAPRGSRQRGHRISPCRRHL